MDSSVDPRRHHWTCECLACEELRAKVDLQDKQRYADTGLRYPHSYRSTDGLIEHKRTDR